MAQLRKKKVTVAHWQAHGKVVKCFRVRPVRFKHGNALTLSVFTPSTWTSDDTHPHLYIGKKFLLEIFKPRVKGLGPGYYYELQVCCNRTRSGLLDHDARQCGAIYTEYEKDFGIELECF